MSLHPTSHAYPSYLTTAEAAEYLRLSSRTLEKHRCIGTGPRFRKVGRMIRYTISDLDKWVSARVYEMTSEPDDTPSKR
jgi:excisionase family DNA binding protein